MPGFWASTWWPASFWPLDWWPEYGLVADVWGVAAAFSLRAPQAALSLRRPRATFQLH